MIRRRQAIAGAAALGAAACTKMSYPPIPKRLLNGYEGIADLPYFQFDPQGQIELTPAMKEELPETIDFHSHLGHSFLLSKAIDYHQEHDRTDYLVNCVADDPKCEYNLNDYLNKIAKPDLIKEMDKKILTGLVPSGSAAARTHTIPNIVKEMDRVKVKHAVMLAVAPRLPFNYNPTQEWIDTIAASDHKDRFTMFAGINVKDSGAKGQLRHFAAQGCKGVKLHPTMQHVSPDCREAMEIYEICEELGLTVFYHAGRAGIEPAYGRQFARLHNYVTPVRDFPNVKFVFGHAGARDWREAMAVAHKYDNVWLEIEGQGVYELQTMVSSLGHERLVFGTDWPFYPIVASMARVLVATDGNTKARDAILASNAQDLLQLT